MSLSRTCTKTACSAAAVATLTYAYADRAIVVGPLATYAEPHSYDLCAEHAMRLTAPRGWEVVRLSAHGYEPIPDHDDLVAVLEAVREAPPATSLRERIVEPAPGPVGHLGERRGHLRVLRGDG